MLNKKAIVFIILSSLIIGGIGGWIFTWYLIPKLNTVSWLVKYNLVPTSAPLVINTTKEVRVNEGADSVAAIQAVKPWLVGIIAGNSPQSAAFSGGGIILTSDGLIATTKSAIAAAMQTANFSSVENSQGNVVLNLSFSDGTTKPAAFAAEDPATGLVFLKVSGAGNLSTASLGYVKNLQVGERVMPVWPSLTSGSVNDAVAYVNSLNDLIPGQLYSSDKINGTFSLSGDLSAPSGSAIVSLDNDIEGLLDNGKIISADAIRGAFNSFTQSGKISRLYLGIHYEYVPKPIALLYENGRQGVLVEGDKKTQAVVAASPAAKAGLQAGDFITAVDGTAIGQNNSFEGLLYKNPPGQTVKFAIIRGGKSMNISAVLGQE